MRSSAAVDHGCARRINRVGGDAFDEVAFDEHVGVFDPGLVHAVKHVHIREQSARGIVLRNGDGTPSHYAHYGDCCEL